MKIWMLVIAVLLSFGLGYWIVPSGYEYLGSQEVVPRILAKDFDIPVNDDVGAYHNVVSSMDDLSDGQTVEALKVADPIDRFDYFYRWIRRSKVAEYASIMQVMNSVEGKRVSQAKHLLLNEWVRVDPEGMYDYLLSQPAEVQHSMGYSFFGAWAETDPQSAYAAAMGMPNNERQRSVQAVIYAIAEGEPLLAISMADANPEIAKRSSHVYGAIFQRWAQRDIAEARSAALAIPDAKVRLAALRGALREWSKSAPKEALQWVEALPRDYTGKAVFRDVFNRFFRENPDQAKSYIENKDSSFERCELLSELHFNDIGRSGGIEEIRNTFDWLETVATGRLYDQKVGDLVRALAENDPDQAVDFVHGMRSGNVRMTAISRLASELAGQSPEAAFAFVDSLEYADERARALSNMGWQLARGEISATAEIVSQHSDPMVQERLVGQLAREWAFYDRESALEWTEQLEHISAKQKALRSVISQWMQEDPRSTFSYIESLPVGIDRSPMYENGFGKWARQDPELAAKWLEYLPEDSSVEINRLYGSVAQNFIQHDPLAASEWISTLELGTARDQSIKVLVSKIVKSDPEAAFLWSETVEDVNMRTRSITKSAREWAKVNPEEAALAVKGLDLEEGVKQKLFNEIEKAGK